LEKEAMPYLVTDDCILCGVCVAGCPSGAIEEGETKSRINVDICLECGTCAQNCPSGAIIFVEMESMPPEECQRMNQPVAKKG
jgi:ferredoxin